MPGNLKNTSTSIEPARSLRLLKDIVIAANQARSAQEALDFASREIINFTGWYAAATMLADDENHLALTAVHGLSPEESRQFAPDVENLKLTGWDAGVGIPGRILLSKQPAWVTDEDVLQNPADYPKSTPVLRLGAKTMIAFPVMVLDRVGAVLFFYSRERLKPDQFLTELLADVGVQLGRVIEREQAEKKLRASEQLQQLALSGARLGLWHRVIGTGAVVMDARTCAIIGCEPHELEQNFNAFLSLVHPEDAMRVRQQIDTHLRGETAAYEAEFRILHKAGHWVWVMARGRVAERDRHGTPLRIAGTMMDITDRKRSEDALRESEARYRGIFDGAIEGMYRTSVEGRNLLANPALAHTLGYDSAEDVVRSVTDAARQVWVDAKERARFVRLLQEQGTVRGFECRYKRKNGTIIWVSLNSHAVRSPGGEILYFEGFIEDITDRKRSEHELRQRTHQFERANKALHEKQLALREVLASVEADKKAIGELVVTNVEKVIMPMLRSLRESMRGEHANSLCQIQEALDQITSPFTRQLSRQFTSLTPTELKICTFIRNGLGVKQIAEIDHLSAQTVATHRRNIRRKLGIAHQKSNLVTYLRTFMQSEAGSEDTARHAQEPDFAEHAIGTLQ